MQVRTVTTSDSSLLHAVRDTLRGADEALLCVAFVQERGLRLLEKELDDLRTRAARRRLLVTTAFQSTPPSALGLARALGLEPRVLNPGSGATFHPKLYLARHGASAAAVIGSANLTGGLATNLEAAVALEGRHDEEPLARVWQWAEHLWRDPRVETWQPSAVGEPTADELDPTLFLRLDEAVRTDPVFRTLGPAPRRNRVTLLTRLEVHVETERSRATRGGAAPIPAWMFNLAWDRLRTHGSLSNVELLDDLRVHRSSAVCAILARLRGVGVAPGRPIRLLWSGA